MPQIWPSALLCYMRKILSDTYRMLCKRYSNSTSIPKGFQIFVRSLCLVTLRHAPDAPVGVFGGGLTFSRSPHTPEQWRAVAADSRGRKAGETPPRWCPACSHLRAHGSRPGHWRGQRHIWSVTVTGHGQVTGEVGVVKDRRESLEQDREDQWRI